MHVQKLRRTLKSLRDHLKQRGEEDFDNFCQILQGQFQLNQNQKRRIATQVSEQYREKPHLVSIKNKKRLKAGHITKKNAQSVSANQNLSHSREFKESNNDKQKLLAHQKRLLMTELNKIDSELKQCQQQKKSIQKHQRIMTEIDESEMYKKASEFIKKMNSHRKQFNLRRKRSAKKINKKINESIQTYQAALMQQQRLKQIKRLQIQNRIQDRKNQTLIRHKINRRSNSIIKQLFKILPLHSSMHDIQEHVKVHHSIQKNPENQSYQQTQDSLKPYNTNRAVKIKKYEVSPFLQKIVRQEEIQKKEEYLKKMERKRVALKHKEYADKIRGKAKVYAEDTMFIT